MFGDEWAAQAAGSPPQQAEEGATHRALYLRWRPRRFQDVVGQEHVTRTLRNAVVRDRLAHAYLFTGPRGTGKTSVARILYRAANCERAVAGDPCNTCPLCTAALDGRALDLVEIDAASNRGIDDMRDLRDKVAYRPGEGRYRLYIIDEAHELTGAAWDAFLKTLEEPPAHAIFVLATTEAHKVPATILSRCQRFDFRRIPFEATRGQLARVAEAEGLEVEGAVLDRLARAARGGLRDALSLLDQLGAFAGGRVDMGVARAVLGLPPAEAVRAVVEALGRRDAAAALTQVADLAEGGADLRQVVDELVAHLRGVLLVRAGAEAPLAVEFPAEDLVWLRAQAPEWPTGGLMVLVQELSAALGRTRDAQQFQVQVELALLGAAGTEPSPREAAPARAPSPLGPMPPARQTVPAPPEPARPVAAPALPGPAPVTASVPAAAAPNAPTFPFSERAAAPALGGRETPLANEPQRDESIPSEEQLRLAVERWSDVVEHVKARKPLVGAALSTARPIRIDGQVLVVDVGSPFHRKRVDSAANRAAIERALHRALGRQYRVRCAVGGDPAAGPSLLDDPVISYAARTFGGEPRRLADQPATHATHGTPAF